MTFGEKVRARRLAMGPSLRQFAKTVGMSYSYLYMIEEEGLVPSPKIVLKLAERLQMGKWFLIQNAIDAKTKALRERYEKVYRKECPTGEKG
ncbi:MAG: helix-turn-helix transcriptional regulator [Planctomycetes bacterium]|nr:helix-turn-helix transcriptional regulator [Planctomycetota bacterium]